jgi:hypothetical protein
MSQEGAHPAKSVLSTRQLLTRRRFRYHSTIKESNLEFVLPIVDAHVIMEHLGEQDVRVLR